MRRTTIAVALAALVAGITTSVAGASPGTGTAGSPGDEHRRVVEFWTPQRQAAAVPVDIRLPAVKPDNPGNGKGGGGGGSEDSSSGTVTGDTWTGGGPVASIVGKVFFRQGGGLYTCSGSAVGSGPSNVVLTAGHCVHGGGPGAAFVTEWVFYPGWDGAPDPTLGAWTATNLFTTSGWAASGDFDDDAGFALVTGSGSLAAALGGSLPSVGFGTASGEASSFGFPAAKKYKGHTLTYCQGPTVAHYDGNDTLALACDMTGGSSGGPWYGEPFDNDGADLVVSLNSYGYSSLNGVMFGPIFDSPEQATYNAASSGSCTPGTGYVCT